MVTANLQNVDNEGEGIYIDRSKLAKLPSACSVDYIPDRSIRLTEEDREKVGVINADYFNIYYKDSGDLLQAFYDDLRQG